MKKAIKIDSLFYLTYRILIERTIVRLESTDRAKLRKVYKEVRK